MRPAHRPASGLVATVAGRAITTADLEAKTAAVRRGPRGRHFPPEGVGSGSDAATRWLVQELVTEAVLDHEVRAAGLPPESPGSIPALVDLVTSAVRVEEREVRAYYDRNRDLYERPEVRVALGLDAGGAAIEIRRGELSGELEDALFAARVGDVVGPFRTENGMQLARLEAVTPATVVPFDEARDAIAAELLADARVRAFGEWLDARRRAIAVIEPAWAHPGDPINGLPGHRH